MPGTEVRCRRTIQRSPKKAQETYEKVLENAEEQYGDGERAHRTAFAALKQGVREGGRPLGAEEASEDRPIRGRPCREDRRRSARDAARRSAASTSSATRRTSCTNARRRSVSVGAREWTSASWRAPSPRSSSPVAPQAPADRIASTRPTSRAAASASIAPAPVARTWSASRITASPVRANAHSAARVLEVSRPCSAQSHARQALRTWFGLPRSSASCHARLSWRADRSHSPRDRRDERRRRRSDKRQARLPRKREIEDRPVPRLGRRVEARVASGEPRSDVEIQLPGRRRRRVAERGQRIHDVLETSYRDRHRRDSVGQLCETTVRQRRSRRDEEVHVARCRLKVDESDRSGDIDRLEIVAERRPRGSQQARQVAGDRPRHMEIGGGGHPGPP